MVGNPTSQPQSETRHTAPAFESSTNKLATFAANVKYQRNQISWN